MERLTIVNAEHCSIIAAICPYEHSCSVCRLHSDYETAKEKAKEKSKKLKEKLKEELKTVPARTESSHLLQFSDFGRIGS